MSSTKFPTAKEIGSALNNATAMAFNSEGMASAPEARKIQLRAYLGAMLEVLVTHVKDGEVTADELVASLTAGALFIHVLLIAKGGWAAKLAMYQHLAKSMLEDAKA
jgi:hypothetical protein